MYFGLKYGFRRAALNREPREIRKRKPISHTERTELELTFEGGNYYCDGCGSEAALPKLASDAHRCCGRAEMEGVRKRAGQVRREYDNLMGDPYTIGF
jgi:hypothetical protein